MATAKKLPSGSWRCQVYSHTEEINMSDGTIKKKRIYKSFTCSDPSKKGKRICEQEAAAWAADKENEIELNENNQIAHQDITLQEACEQYITNRTGILSPGTIREYKRSVRKDLQNLMPLKLMEITQEEIQEEINRESLSHSPKTIRNMHGFLSTVLKVYRPNFALRTALPQKARPKLYVPTDEEIQKVLLCVQGTEMEIPVLLAAFGPMRRSEICALHSDHIDRNVVHVEYAMVMNDSHSWVVKRPKSFAGDRFIPVPDFVYEKLKGVNGKVTELNPSQISDRFADVLDNNGIHHFRFHDLRHYCASALHSAGIPDAYIMQRGGWEDDTTLKNVYRHTLRNREKEMNDIGNNYFSEVCNTKCNTNFENTVK